MSPDEVIKKLESMGIHISRKTLLRYEENKLIPAPKRGSEGRGKGRFTDYPENTPYEFFASWYCIKKEDMDIDSTSLAREEVLNGTNDERYSNYPCHCRYDEFTEVEFENYSTEIKRSLNNNKWRRHLFNAKSNSATIVSSYEDDYKYLTENTIDMLSRIGQYTEFKKELNVMKQAGVDVVDINYIINHLEKIETQ